MLSGLTVDASSKELAIEHFTALWNSRSKLEWRFEAPPQPRRHDAKPASLALEGDTIATRFHRSILRAFHADLHGPKKRWSADQILQIVNEKWTASHADVRTEAAAK
jgi:hypothetical protein